MLTLTLKLTLTLNRTLILNLTIIMTLKIKTRGVWTGVLPLNVCQYLLYQCMLSLVYA